MSATFEIRIVEHRHAIGRRALRRQTRRGRSRSVMHVGQRPANTGSSRLLDIFNCLALSIHGAVRQRHFGRRCSPTKRASTSRLVPRSTSVSPGLIVAWYLMPAGAMRHSHLDAELLAVLLHEQHEHRRQKSCSRHRLQGGHGDGPSSRRTPPPSRRPCTIASPTIRSPGDSRAAHAALGGASVRSRPAASRSARDTWPRSGGPSRPGRDGQSTRGR